MMELELRLKFDSNIFKEVDRGSLHLSYGNITILIASARIGFLSRCNLNRYFRYDPNLKITILQLISSIIASIAFCFVSYSKIFSSSLPLAVFSISVERHPFASSNRGRFFNPLTTNVPLI